MSIFICSFYYHELKAVGTLRMLNPKWAKKDPMFWEAKILGIGCGDWASAVERRSSIAEFWSFQVIRL